MQITIPKYGGDDFKIPEEDLEKYEPRQVSKLLTGDMVKGSSILDLEVLAVSFPKGRSGYTVVTMMNMMTLEHGTQVYRNNEKLLVRK